MSSETKRKTEGLLTICMKAGKAVKGFDSAKEAADTGKAFCILTASDASEKTVKEVRFFSEKINIPVYVTELDKSEIGKLCGKDTAVIAVCDKGFAGGFERILGTTQ